MQTQLSSRARQLDRAQDAERILRSCVHCGFCNATCPTYLEAGNELDGPRGRIYLIKQFLERDEAGPLTLSHLDRCLLCRNCETTCPSGVEYHHLLDIGRSAVAQSVPRPAPQRLLRHLLLGLLPRPRLTRPLWWLALRLRPVLPAVLRAKLPRRPAQAGPVPAPRHARHVLMLDGCVQQSLAPATNGATARVLDRLGISTRSCPAVQCCGALEYHLDAQEQALNRARRNIDAWWPHVQNGAEAIVQTASGCGAFIKEYGDLLAKDPAYADKARQISALAKDLIEVLEAEPLEQLGPPPDTPVAFHCPCTLQHAQKLGERAQALLRRAGLNLTPVPDGHLCCGSAGAYSITQPDMARSLRDNKLAALESGRPELIVTANIGCQLHLDGAGRTPVQHWIELLDQAASPANHARSTTMHS